MNQEERLKQKKSELEQQWDDLSQKLAVLRNSIATETRPEEKLRLQTLITEAEADRDSIGKQLDDVEKRLSTLLNALADSHDDEVSASILSGMVAGNKSSDIHPKPQRTPTHEQPGLPRPFPLEPPEGLMHPDSPFYIERSGDQIVKEEIKRKGTTITIKGPRQVGKSSMLVRVVDAAAELGKQVAILDFQLFDRLALDDADIFFKQFCIWLADELDIEDRVEKYWRQPLGNIQRCTRYMSRYLLRQLDRPLLLTMDNVDAIFNTDFCDDFFGMLHSWHDSRGKSIQPIWQQLDLILVTSTEPYQFIKNLNQSPFNVGSIIELLDFNQDQVSELNHRHGRPFTSDQVQQLMNLVSGHPYLVRQALYWVAGQHHSPAELFERATEDQGPFGPHLHRLLRRLLAQPEQQTALQQVIEHNRLSNEPMFLRLQGAGLVRRERKDVVLPRCHLYAAYFRERLTDD